MLAVNPAVVSATEGMMLALNATEIISAQVSLRPKSGKTVDGSTIITSENVAEYAPSAEAMAAASQAFSARGFTVSPQYGMGFSITAPVRIFESVFQTSLVRSDGGGVHTHAPDGSITYELPLYALPTQLQPLIYAVTFTPPPDFGPTSFAGP